MSILNPRKALLIPLLGVGLLVSASAVDGNKITKFNQGKESNEQALARVGNCIPYVDKGRLIEGEVYVTHEPDPKDPTRMIEQRLGDGNYLCDMNGNTAQTIGSAANYYRTADSKSFAKAFAAKFGMPLVENQTEPTMPTAQEIADSGAVIAHKSKHYRPNHAKRQHKPKATEGNWFMSLFQPAKK